MSLVLHGLLFVLLCCVYFSHSTTPEDESCHSYAGGSVYPTGVSKEETEHKLQWTKAVSKFLN